MIKNLFFICLILTFWSCKNNSEAGKSENEPQSVEEGPKSYPGNISKVFEAHGGLDKWNSMNTLRFTMVTEEEDNVITTDLQSRMALIETPNFRMGYDGDSAWVEQDSTYFEGDPNFYYDLMFYFYAMPFILSDDGINYSDADALHFNGTDYPGIKISYNNDVGASPEDEYILYYNPETYKMEWLGYTVTYFSKEKSDEFRYIKYNEWQSVEGLLLPKTLQWYGFEGDSITTKRNDRYFKEVSLKKERLSKSVFKKNN